MRHVAGDGTQVPVTLEKTCFESLRHPPALEQLDANRDGYSSPAEAYPPLFDDFDFLAHYA